MFRSAAAQAIHAMLLKLHRRLWLSQRAMVERAAQTEPGLLAWYESHIGKPTHIAAPKIDVAAASQPAASKLLPVPNADKIIPLKSNSRTPADVKKSLVNYCNHTTSADLREIERNVKRQITAQTHWSDAQRAGMLAWVESENLLIEQAKYRIRRMARKSKAKPESKLKKALELIKTLQAPAVEAELQTWAEWLISNTGGTEPKITQTAEPDAAPRPPAIAAPSAPAQTLPNDNAAAIDPEFARAAIALKFDHALRIWAAIRASVTTGRGAISLRQLPAVLRRLDIEMDARTRRQAIAAGSGVFFRVDRKTGKLYLISYARVADILTKRALRDAPDVVSTNPPGRQPRYIVLSGSATAFCARVYAAWLDMKADRAQGISRFTLRALWQVSDNTLRSWEKHAGIEAVRAEAQYAGDNAELIPLTDDGTPRPDYVAYTVGHERRHAWRVSNHYRAPSVPEKQTGRYATRRVNAKCRLLLEDTPVTELPCSDIGAPVSNGRAGFSPFGRIYFAHTDANESRKRALSHLRHFEDYQRAHYAQLAVKPLKRGDVVIYDVVDRAASMTNAHERYTLAFPRTAQTKARRYA